jgi:chorismate--pyruvate lyase
LEEWLLHQGSLTQQLRLCCGANFNVRLQSQLCSQPLASERRLLAMPPKALALVREVQLCCGNTVWVFARSIIPIKSLQGAARRLKHLGAKPLGSLLFSDPKATRGLMEFAPLLPGHLLYTKAMATQAFDQAVLDPSNRLPTEVWARRSLFFYAGKPLLVNEVFLPEIVKR